VVRVKYDMKQEKEKRKPTKKNGDQLDFRF